MTDTPSREEFEAWQADPVTAFVVAGLRKYAEGQQAAWSALAWGGDLDPLKLERHRTRAEAYADLAALTYDDALGINGEGVAA